MSARIVILTVLDPAGEFGLAPDTRAAHELGVDVIPVCTGVVTRSPDGAAAVRAVRPRLVGAAIEAACRATLDGMLIGLIPDYWQARTVSRTLAKALPETMVYAPLSTGFDARPFLGSYNRRLQMSTLVREATVTVLPADQAAALTGLDAAIEPSGTARALLDAGSYAAWLIGQAPHGRGVDVVATGDRDGILDYPIPAGRSVAPTAAAALAALLALGRPLRESIDAAHRAAAGIGNGQHVRAVR